MYCTTGFGCYEFIKSLSTTNCAALVFFYGQQVVGHARPVPTSRTYRFYPLNLGPRLSLALRGARSCVPLAFVDFNHAIVP